MKKILLPLLTAAGILIGSITAKAEGAYGNIPDVLSEASVQTARVELVEVGIDTTDEFGNYEIFNNVVSDPIIPVYNGWFEEIKIYNILGQEVKKLNDGPISNWNGMDNNGSYLASGVYLFQANDWKYSGKIVLQEGNLVGVSLNEVSLNKINNVNSPSLVEIVSDGRTVDRFHGNLNDIMTNNVNIKQEELSKEYTFSIIKDNNIVSSGEFNLVKNTIIGNSFVELNSITILDKDGFKASNRSICADYSFKVTHPDYYPFENPVEINGNTNINMPIIPLTFDMDFFNEVCCDGEPPNYEPLHPTHRWMNNPQIYFSTIYPAPDLIYQNIVEEVILYDLPEFTNGVIVPEITNDSSFCTLIVGYVPSNLLPENAGGMHNECFENPENQNEITGGSVCFGDFITNTNSRRSIALHELTQCLINASDSQMYPNTIFGGYGPSLINYSQEDLDLGKIIYCYPVGISL